jgi:hypothetical protein
LFKNSGFGIERHIGAMRKRKNLKFEIKAANIIKSKYIFFEI